MLWLALVTLIKLSALDLYANIFRQPIFVMITRIVFGICAAAGIAFTLVRALICRPVAMNWDFSLAAQGGKCGDLHTMYLSLASIDLVLDLLVVFLPMPVVWTLQMAFSKKIAISAVFGLGAAYVHSSLFPLWAVPLELANFCRSICCITAVRLKFISQINVLDEEFSQIKFNIFAALEPLLGIINACLPVLPPVFAKFFHSAAFRSAFKSSGVKSSTGEIELKNFNGRKGPGLVSSASAGRQFERLDDEYPLNDLQKSRATSN